MQQLDEMYHDILKNKNPDLYNTICSLVAMGQTPAVITRKAEKISGASSVLPSLIEATVRVCQKANKTAS